MEILRNEPLAPKTTFRIGGAASYFADAISVEDIQEALSFGRTINCAVLILGGGSNVLVPDRGYDGLVIHVGVRGFEKKDEGNTILLEVGAEEVWDEVVKWASEEGWYGIENLSGIPGSVGATPIQNVGAYGAEVGEVIEWVEVLDMRNGQVRRFSNDECGFSYRDSFFKTTEGRHYIILRVAFRLSKRGMPDLSYRDLKEYFVPQSTPSLAEVREAVLAIRSKKFPDLSHFGTAGSFFKNPIISAEAYTALAQGYPGIPGFSLRDGRVKIPLAWLLERLGWKGVREGAVGTFSNQPLVVVNHGGATAQEIQAFTDKITSEVFEKTKIKIEPEVRLL